MKRIFFFILICFVGAGVSFGQTKTIRGKVTSSEDNLTLPGVTVVAVGSTVGAVTDVDGNYSITVPSDVAQLKFSFIGFAAQVVDINGRTSVDVVLQIDVTGLEEVVVTGYSTQRKIDIAGSVSAVSTDELAEKSLTSIDKILQGRAAGVMVYSQNGQPGGDVSIQVRGQGSINAGTRPLFIVDGVQVVTGDNTRLSTTSNALAGINPDDIESINILKDASAAAIYGAQAANGVVLITTKRGKTGKTNFNFSATGGMTSLLNKIDVMTGPEYAELTLEAFRNRYGETGGSYLTRLALFQSLGFGADGYSEAPTYDWQDEVFKTGYNQEYKLSVSGGDEKTRFFISGSYNYTSGQVISTDFDRTTFRVNLDHKVNDKFSMETNFGWSNYTNNTVPADGRYSNPYRTSWLTIPVNAWKDADGNWIPSNDPVFLGSYDFNVIYEFTEGLMSIKAANNKITGNQAFNWEIMPGLTFRSNWGLDWFDVVEDLWQDPRSGDGQSDNGYIAKYQTRRVNWQSSNTLNFTKSFGQSDLTVLAGAEYKQSVYNSLSAAAYGVPNYKFNIMSAAATPDVASAGYSIWKILSFFGRADYIFAKKYIVNGTVRYDGSSRFGAEKRFGFFPSIGAAWRFSEEPFMDFLTFVDDGRLRASYGITGNNSIGDFDSRGFFAGGPDYDGSAGMNPSRLENAQLTWEQSATTNLGLSLNMFSNRVIFEFDAYRRVSSLLLLDRPLPWSTGWDNMNQNIGVVQNQGLEFLLSTVNISTPDFSWRTDFTLSLEENEIKELLPGVDKLNDRIAVGHGINDRRLPIWAGVNPADGRPMWYDKDGNITYNPVADDRQWMGPYMPKWYGGFTNTLSYKGVELSAMFQFSGGNRRYSSEMTFGARSGNTADRNQYASQYDDRWQQPGDITWVAKPVYGSAYGGSLNPYTYSSRNYQKVDYLRLKDITLSYNLPKSILSKVNISAAKVFVQGTNQWTLTQYIGFDPEYAGTDFGTYPQGKSWNFGINLSF